MLTNSRNIHHRPAQLWHFRDSGAGYKTYLLGEQMYKLLLQTVDIMFYSLCLLYTIHHINPAFAAMPNKPLLLLLIYDVNSISWKSAGAKFLKPRTATEREKPQHVKTVQTDSMKLLKMKKCTHGSRCQISPRWKLQTSQIYWNIVLKWPKQKHTDIELLFVWRMMNINPRPVTVFLLRAARLPLICNINTIIHLYLN